MACAQDDMGPKRKTILVVDDQPHVRRLLRHILDSRGYTVLEGEDHETTIATLQGHTMPVDLAVIDIDLPGRGGREVAASLTDLGVTHTLFISGHDPAALIAEGRLDAKALLVRKPFTVAGVLSAVQATLKRKPHARDRERDTPAAC